MALILVQVDQLVSLIQDRTSHIGLSAQTLTKTFLPGKLRKLADRPLLKIGLSLPPHRLCGPSPIMGLGLVT